MPNMHDNWISNRQKIIQLKVIKKVPISRKSPQLVDIKKIRENVLIL